jgi:hypothetical protein
MRPLQRLQPAGPASAYKTYVVDSPRDTMIKAACEQVDCPARRHGWETPVDESTPLGARQAAYIRHQSGRTFTEHHTAGGLTVFRFPSGQRCFTDHRTRPETFTVVAGDWRQYGGLIYRHTRPADWVEDFGTHQQQLADRLARG